MSTEFLMDEYCFACGARNENGLKLKIIEADDGVRARIVPPAWSQGYANVVHGGIIATILDELAVWAAFKQGYRSVTAEFTMRIKGSMNTKEIYTALARVCNIKHRLIEAESEICDDKNACVAIAHVKLLQIES
ncbi:MAG: PaaI family thioesterase [candidate division WOR-3 bacterium]|nr:MAG: PaaI family thioesterase [candidate division WOR-3 bacterium]